jgi:hypothetical protein
VAESGLLKYTGGLRGSLNEAVLVRKLLAWPE